MALDWSKPLCTKHDVPLVGDMRGKDDAGRRLVALPSLSVGSKQAHKNPTTYHYSDAGNCSVIAEPNIFDLVNFDSRDDIRRIRLDLAR